MELESLTRSQIVLLTLLVSFVTSIATGIVTVSLMDQAPPVVAQTVNRVIEHTVEKVVQSAQSQTAAASTPEKTVVIKESDLISAAIEHIGSSVVRFYSLDTANPTFLGLGVVVDNSGALITDKSAIGEASAAVVELSDGTRVSAVVVSRDESTGIAHLMAATSTPDGKPVAWRAANIAAKAPVLGNTVVMISGKTTTKIADGIVTSLLKQDAGTALIDTNIPEESVMFGSVLVDTDGSIMGLSTAVSRSVAPTSFIPAATLLPKPKPAVDEKK